MLSKTLLPSVLSTDDMYQNFGTLSYFDMKTCIWFCILVRLLLSELWAMLTQFFHISDRTNSKYAEYCPCSICL